MRVIVSKILYYMGDLISNLFYYKFFCKFSRLLFPIYSKLMLWSVDLDKNEKVWKVTNKRKLHE